MPTSSIDGYREIPPTAGLPFTLSDFLPARKADFPRSVAAFLGVERVGIECSGTASLIVILRTLHRLSGRRAVIIPAYTCPLVVLAIVHCGLQPRLCDLAADGLDLALSALADLCDGDTLAIIPTHLGGRVVDVAGVVRIAQAVGAYVVEDAAQAFGARAGGRSVGLTGDAAFFSFAAGKGLSIFEGGAWLARCGSLQAECEATSRQDIPDRKFLEATRALQLIGLAVAYRPRLLRPFYGDPLRRSLRQGDPVRAVGDDFELPIPLHRVGSWRQGIGARALGRLPEFQDILRRQAAERVPVLDSLPGVKVFSDGEDTAGVWPFFLLVLPNESCRDAVLRELWGSGRGVTRLFIHALPDYAYLRPWLPDQECPNARGLAARALTVTNSPWLDDAAFGKVVASIRRHL